MEAVVAQNARPSFAIMVDWYYMPGLVDHELIFLILVFDVFLVFALLVLLDGSEGGIEVGLEMGGARGVFWSGLRILVRERLVGQDHGTSLLMFQSHGVVGLVLAGQKLVIILGLVGYIGGCLEFRHFYKVNIILQPPYREGMKILSLFSPEKASYLFSFIFHNFKDDNNRIFY